MQPNIPKPLTDEELDHFLETFWEDIDNTSIELDDCDAVVEVD
jgi:hypothetical protein